VSRVAFQNSPSAWITSPRISSVNQTIGRDGPFLTFFFEALQLFGFRAFVDKARRPRMSSLMKKGDDRDTELYRFHEFDLCVRSESSLSD